MNIPSRVWSDEQVNASCINNIIACLESMRLVGDPGSIMVQETPSGSVISAILQASSQDSEQESSLTPFPAVVQSGTTADGYAVAIYGDGFDADATGSGTLKALNLAFGGTALASGLKYMAYPSEMAVTGGND